MSVTLANKMSLEMIKITLKKGGILLRIHRRKIYKVKTSYTFNRNIYCKMWIQDAQILSKLKIISAWKCVCAMNIVLK